MYNTENVDTFTTETEENGCKKSTIFFQDKCTLLEWKWNGEKKIVTNFALSGLTISLLEKKGWKK